jgi:5-methylcytosine-specific restriction endonuclease McrA
MVHNWSNARRDATPRGWAALRKRILQRDRHLCQIRYDGYCTGRATEVDHKQGRDNNHPSNLQAACTACNQRKNILTRPTPKRASERRPPEAHPGLLRQ